MPGTSNVPCPKCKGTGKVVVKIHGTITKEKVCPVCHGNKTLCLRTK